MSVLDSARVIIYRFHEKGLEIFLVNSDMENDPDIWKLPKGNNMPHVPNLESIHLETQTDEEGRAIKTLAVEGEWHDIPSIRGMLRHIYPQRPKPYEVHLVYCLFLYELLSVCSAKLNLTVFTYNLRQVFG